MHNVYVTVYTFLILKSKLTSFKIKDFQFMISLMLFFKTISHTNTAKNQKKYDLKKKLI